MVARVLEQSRAQKVRLEPELPPVLLLTDGAVEDCVTVGAVLDDRTTGVLEVFGASVRDTVAARWGRMCGREQVIGQAEIAPLVLAARIWEDRLRGR